MAIYSEYGRILEFNIRSLPYIQWLDNRWPDIRNSNHSVIGIGADFWQAIWNPAGYKIQYPVFARNPTTGYSVVRYPEYFRRKCGKRKMQNTMNTCMNMYICNVQIFPLSSSRLFLIKKRVREAGKSSILIIKQGRS